MRKELKLLALQKACVRYHVDFDGLIEDCRIGKAQFFEGEDAVALTKISTVRGKGLLYIVVVAGKLEGVPEVYQKIETMARSLGIDRIHTIGRDGFGRNDLYKSLADGFAPVGTLYEKVLSDG